MKFPCSRNSKFRRLKADLKIKKIGYIFKEGNKKLIWQNKILLENVGITKRDYFENGNRKIMKSWYGYWYFGKRFQKENNRYFEMNKILSKTC